MSGRPGPAARAGRLLGDLLHGDTRGAALRRVRHRTTAGIGRVLRRADDTGAAADTGGASAARASGWYTAAWTRLAGAVAGAPDPAAGGARTPDVAADQAREAAVLGRATRQRAEATLAQAIAEGAGLEAAAVRATRALAASGEWADWNAAWTMLLGLGRLEGGAAAAAMGQALLLHGRGQYARAWNPIRGLDDALLAARMPVEAVDAALAASTADPEGLARARSIGARPELEAGADLVAVAGRLLAYGERERAFVLLDRLDDAAAAGLDAGSRRAVARMRSWLASVPVAVPDGSVSLGVLVGDAPEGMHAAPDIDDDLRALAVVGLAARLGASGVSGVGGLGELAAELRRDLPAADRIEGAARPIHLVPIDPHANAALPVPAGTWTIACGPHVDPLYDLRSEFPYAHGIRPLFVSFQLSRPEVLTDEALEYLRRYGPVGCADWSTVFLLLGAGVDAFFSGCLTATLGPVIPGEARQAGKGITGLIDTPRVPAKPARTDRVYRHTPEDTADLTPADRLRAARRAMGAYRRDLDRAVTGRGQVALALAAAGVPVELTPRYRGNPRLAGLLDVPADPGALASMRDGILGLVDPVFSMIVDRAAESAVYERWRELTRDRVANARARFSAPVDEARTAVDIEAAARAARDGRRAYGPHDAVDPDAVTDLVIAYDQNLTYPAAVLLESVVAGASGPVRVWILGRGLDEAYERWLAAAFPALPITFFPCDRISYDTGGPRRRIPRRITVSTMDRLLLPLLLGDVRRVVYLDVDTLMLGDVCRLASVDLGGHPVAARDSNVSEASEWQRAGTSLDEAAATTLRRTMAAQHGFGSPALNAGVLVMDLDRMRRDDFASRFLGFGERFGLHDQDTMLAYVGPGRAVLDARWNALPVLEDPVDPWLIHWASFPKPWDAPLTYERERWQAVASRLTARAGMPPTAAPAPPAP
jgi:lipopolysaccharide biosynthesis glycosyltransferase